MTAPTFAQSAAKHLEIADNLAGKKARKILHSEAGSARHRALLAAEVLTRHVTSRRRQILLTAVLAEQAHTEEVAS